MSYPLSIPAGLRYLVERYQKRMEITSLNQAIRTLLETHPDVDREAREVYAFTNGPEGPDTHGE